MTSATAPISIKVTFPSEKKLEEALSPYNLKEVQSRITASKAPVSLEFHFDETLTSKKIVPLRNTGYGNLFQHLLCKTKNFTIYYPERPRVPYHLTIVLHRKVKGITEISPEENRELFTTIKTIAEIYKTLSVDGFVIAQFNAPQQGHEDRFVIEILPHLPGFKDKKNMEDKLDSNRYVLFRKANLSPMIHPIEKETIEKDIAHWKAAFEKQQSPISEESFKATFPYELKETHQTEAKKLLVRHLIEMLEDKGGAAEEIPQLQTQGEDVETKTLTRCAFCNPEIIKKQRVFEYENVTVLYNVRKGPQVGSLFLILPKRHIEKVYGLHSEEIDNICFVRKALTDVLKESHPASEVVVFIQDDPSVGQSVLHSHEHVVVFDPETIVLSWTLISLDPRNVTDEEMSNVTQEVGKKLELKIKARELEKVA